MGKKDIEKFQFQKGNQLAVGKGRPPKLVSGIIKDLRDKGYKNVKPSQVTDLMEILLALPKTELIDLWDNKDTPNIASTIAKQLSRDDKAWEAINLMLDRAHGKATQKQELKVEGNIETSLSELTNEQLDALINASNSRESKADKSE